MDFPSKDVKEKLNELLQLVTRNETVSSGVVEHSTRLLRPRTNQGSDFSNAIKQKIHRSILTNSSGVKAGPNVVADFEKEYESLRKFGSAKKLQLFLMLLEPLSFSLSSNGVIDGSLSSEMDRLHVDHSQANKAQHDGNVKLRGSAAISAMMSDGMLPIVAPYHTVGADLHSPEIQQAWLSEETECKLIKDLLFLFQVIKLRSNWDSLLFSY